MWIVLVNLAATLEKLHNSTGAQTHLKEAAEINKEAVMLQMQGLGEGHPDAIEPSSFDNAQGPGSEG